MGQTTSRVDGNGDITLQAPATLMGGWSMGSPQISAPRLTEMEHPAVNAGMGGITVPTGGGRLNPWGNAGIVNASPPFRYTPTLNMPGGVPFAESIIEARMGGEVVTGRGGAVSWNRFLSDNRNANPVSSPDSYGSTIFSR